MKLKICPKCKRPFLESKEFCPDCPEPYSWNQESWSNMGCLVLMILPVAIFVFVWLFLVIAVLLR
ncbi:MAG: hypothetical protein KIS76_12110 [Pyrinomonadaceae bacterium]|nr:hypothetical protein [Pyrinomonadaceae bacterium]